MIERRVEGGEHDGATAYVAQTVEDLVAIGQMVRAGEHPVVENVTPAVVDLGERVLRLEALVEVHVQQQQSRIWTPDGS